MLRWLTILLFIAPALAWAEVRLVMLDQPGCHWCERWTEEIGPIYPKTQEGQRAPLVRMDIDEGRAQDWDLVSKPVFTPTFLLMNGPTEVARLEGYPSEDFFWGLLGMMLEKLPSE